MNYLVLTHSTDLSALKVASGLRRRHGADQAAVVSAEALGMAPRWLHTGPLAGQTGEVLFSTTFELAGGLSFCWPAINPADNSPRVIFNRLVSAQALQFAQAEAADRSYAEFETYALWLSWLFSLQAHGVAVINPPSPRQLCGPGFSQMEWLALAAHCGLPVVELSLQADIPVSEHNPATPKPVESLVGENSKPLWLKVLAAGPRLVPEAGPGLDALQLPILDLWQPGIKRLQQAAGCPLLEFYLTDADGSNNSTAPLPGAKTVPRGALRSADWRLAAVDPFPGLQTPAALSAVLELLEDSSRGGEA